MDTTRFVSFLALATVLLISGCVSQTATPDDISTCSLTYAREHGIYQNEGDVVYDWRGSEILAYASVECEASRSLRVKIYDHSNIPTMGPSEVIVGPRVFDGFAGPGRHQIVMSGFHLDNVDLPYDLDVCWVLQDQAVPYGWNQSTEGVVCKEMTFEPPRIDLETIPTVVEFSIEPEGTERSENCAIRTVDVKNNGNIVINIKMVLENGSYAGGLYGNADGPYVTTSVDESRGLLRPGESAQFELEGCVAEGDSDFQPVGYVVVGGESREESVYFKQFNLNIEPI